MKQFLPILLAATAGLAACAAPEAPSIEASDGWARATAPGQRGGAAYFTLTNPGSADDRLVGVSSERGMASLHRTVFENDMASMQPIEGGIAIPAGGEAILQPQADHVMLMGLEAPLVAGERFTVTLDFEAAPDATLDIEVVEAGAR